MLPLFQENKRLAEELESKDTILGLLQSQLNRELECPKCDELFGLTHVPYTYVRWTFRLIHFTCSRRPTGSLDVGTPSV
jgi:hypothetical protein